MTASFYLILCIAFIVCIVLFHKYRTIEPKRGSNGKRITVVVALVIAAFLARSTILFLQSLFDQDFSFRSAWTDIVYYFLTEVFPFVAFTLLVFGYIDRITASCENREDAENAPLMGPNGSAGSVQYYDDDYSWRSLILYK